MPLLAAFIGSLASGLVAVFSRFMAFQMALKLAAYTAWIAVIGTFAASVFICTQGLVTTLTGMFSASSSGSKIISMFGMGLGMLIPANAGTVMACVASVWIATQVYKIQKQGIQSFGS